MNRNLDSLLRWSVENTPPRQEGRGNSDAPSTATAVQLRDSEESLSHQPSPAASTSTPSVAQQKLDPGVIDAILGKSDAQRMRECVQDLHNETLSHREKMLRWDELELLVESLDNANDLENMKLWQPILDFVDDKDDEMRLQACWVLGTAIQNNPRSQTAFLALDPLPRLLSVVRDPSPDVRSKALYTLSSALRHHAIAVARFTSLNGWSVLRECLGDPSISMRRKTAFLIHSLFVHASSTAEVEDYAQHAQKVGLIDDVIDSLSKESATPAGPDGEVEDIDIDYAEKATQILVTLVERLGTKKAFPDAKQRTRLAEVVREIEKEHRIPEDMARSEWETFSSAVLSASA